MHAKLPTEEEAGILEDSMAVDETPCADGASKHIPTAAAGCCPGINPETSLLRMGWDSFLCISVLYTALITTLHLVYMTPEEALQAETESTWVKILVIMWTIDIVVQFHTSYRDNETGYMVSTFWPVHIKHVKARLPSSWNLAILHMSDSARERTPAVRFVKGTALRYVTRFFFFDLFAVVPCIYVFFAPNALPHFFQAGGSRLVKAILLIDVDFFNHGLRRFVHTVIWRLENKYGWEGWNYSYSRAYYRIDAALLWLKQVTAFFITVHAFGTLWYKTGDSNGETDGWIDKQGWDDDTSETTKWLRSVYWSMTTLTTVGYGDISASTNQEMIYTVCAMAVGVLFQAWLIGNVTKEISRATIVDDHHALTMAEIQDYMDSTHVPHELCQRVLHYTQQRFERDRNFGVHSFVRGLTPQLQHEVLGVIYTNQLGRCPCFAGFPQLMLIELCQHIIPFPVKAKDQLFQQGDMAREAYVINCGVDGKKCKVSVHRDAESTSIVQLTDGDIVGVDALVFGYEHCFRKAEATVIADGDLMLIPREAILSLHKTFPDAGVKEHIERFIEFEAISADTDGDDGHTRYKAWTPWQPTENHQGTMNKRLDKIELEMREIKTMLQKIL